MKRIGLALAALCLLFSAVPAQAHDVNVYYNIDPSLPGVEAWPATGPNITKVIYHFESGFGAAARNRVRDAVDAWNAVPNSTFVFEEGDVVPNQDMPTLCNIAWPAYNVIGYQTDLSDPDHAAETKVCNNSAGLIKSFFMAFDSDIDWYTGTATGQFADLWGVATHELGHATGFSGHFPSGGTACTGSTYSTMCDPINSSARTLETHDKHTFSDAY